MKKLKGCEATHEERFMAHQNDCTPGVPQTLGQRESYFVSKTENHKETTQMPLIKMKRICIYKIIDNEQPRPRGRGCEASESLVILELRRELQS